MESLFKVSQSTVPIFVKNSVEYIDKYGLESQGIYRLSGNATTVQTFRGQLNKGIDTDLYVDTQDVNVIAALLKCKSTV